MAQTVGWQRIAAQYAVMDRDPRLILLSSTTGFGHTSTPADVIANELPAANGYTARPAINLVTATGGVVDSADAARTIVFDQVTATITGAGAGITAGGFAILVDGAAVPSVSSVPQSADPGTWEVFTVVTQAISIAAGVGNNFLINITVDDLQTDSVT